MTLDKVILILVITFIFTTLLTPFIIKIAEHIGAIDIPNERKVHTKPMPRLGGLAIFLGFLLGYILFGNKSIEMISILIGGFIIILVGIFDDIKPLKPKYKFIGQLMGASIAVFYGNIVLDNLSFFGLNIDFNLLKYPITLFFILGAINCINLIDGLDGLASGVSSIYFLTIGIIAFITNMLGGLDVILSFVMLGSTLGFLVHNFNPAKIYLGDSGSMFLGYIISIIALLGFKNVTLTSLIVPLLILAIPIFDTLFAIIRRLVNKQPINEPDRQHLHHQLLNMHMSHKKTVIIIYIVNLVFAVISIIYALKLSEYAIVIYILLLILLVIFVLKTNIIFNHKKKEEH